MKRFFILRRGFLDSSANLTSDSENHFERMGAKLAPLMKDMPVAIRHSPHCKAEECAHILAGIVETADVGVSVSLGRGGNVLLECERLLHELDAPSQQIVLITHRPQIEEALKEYCPSLEGEDILHGEGYLIDVDEHQAVKIALQ